MHTLGIRDPSVDANENAGTLLDERMRFFVNSRRDPNRVRPQIDALV